MNRNFPVKKENIAAQEKGNLPANERKSSSLRKEILQLKKRGIFW
jgi:hypothetical protein